MIFLSSAEVNAREHSNRKDIASLDYSISPVSLSAVPEVMFMSYFPNHRFRSTGVSGVEGGDKRELKKAFTEFGA
jgi:hypothetical protein